MINHMVNHISAPRVTDPRALDVLGDRTRRRLLALLAAAPRPASGLADQLGVSRPAVSRHLRLLRSRGLVEEVHVPGDGRMRLCRLRPEPMAEVEQWAQQVRAFWAGQLTAFARLAAEQRPDTTAKKGRRRRR